MQHIPWWGWIWILIAATAFALAVVVVVVMIFVVLHGLIAWAFDRGEYGPPERPLMQCGECGALFDPADLDQVMYHEVHQPVKAHGITGRRITTVIALEDLEKGDAVRLVDMADIERRTVERLVGKPPALGLPYGTKALEPTKE